MAFLTPDELTRTKPTTQPNNSSKAKSIAPFTRSPRAKPKAGTPTNSSKARARGIPRVVGPRPGSKTAKVLALLKRPQGAGLRELLKATGWQPHSVRGFLSGIVTRKMGLKVKSIKAESGERRYAVRP